MNEIVKSVREFNRFYFNLIGLLQSNLYDLQYSLTDCRIMFEIDYYGQISARKLKDLLFIDEGYLSRLISNLVKKKIISKTQSKEDKRIFMLSLTSHGRNELNEINKKSDQQIAGLIKNLTDTDQKQVENMMKELKGILEKVQN